MPLSRADRHLFSWYPAAVILKISHLGLSIKYHPSLVICQVRHYLQGGTKSKPQTFVIYSVSQKNLPEVSDIFHFFYKRLRIFNRLFTHLLYVFIYTVDNKFFTPRALRSKRSEEEYMRSMKVSIYWRPTDRRPVTDDRRPTSHFENFKWPYLRNRSSDPLHVWF